MQGPCTASEMGSWGYVYFDDDVYIAKKNQRSNSTAAVPLVWQTIGARFGRKGYIDKNVPTKQEFCVYTDQHFVQHPEPKRTRHMTKWISPQKKLCSFLNEESRDSRWKNAALESHVLFSNGFVVFSTTTLPAPGGPGRSRSCEWYSAAINLESMREFIATDVWDEMNGQHIKDVTCTYGHS